MQCLHYVNSRSPRCGHGGGDDRCGEQHKRRSDDRQRAGHFQVGDIAYPNAREPESADGAGNDTERGHDCAFGDDSSQEALRRRTEREAYAKFANPRADGERENARDAKGASPGSNCANCGLYQGANGSARGPCSLFPGKEVKAAGWCSSWAPQM